MYFHFYKLTRDSIWYYTCNLCMVFLVNEMVCDYAYWNEIIFSWSIRHYNATVGSIIETTERLEHHFMLFSGINSFIMKRSNFENVSTSKMEVQHILKCSFWNRMEWKNWMQISWRPFLMLKKSMPTANVVADTSKISSYLSFFIWCTKIPPENWDYGIFWLDFWI